MQAKYIFPAFLPSIIASIRIRLLCACQGGRGRYIAKLAFHVVRADGSNAATAATSDGVLIQMAPGSAKSDSVAAFAALQPLPHLSTYASDRPQSGSSTSTRPTSTHDSARPSQRPRPNKSVSRISGVSLNRSFISEEE